MESSEWKERLLKIPGARQVKSHLLSQGHTEAEAEIGGLAASGLVLFLSIVLFNSFIAGMVRAFFNSLWVYSAENPEVAASLGFFSTMAFLGLLFRFSGKKSEAKAKKEMDKRREKHLVGEKREMLRKGAMGNFEAVFREALTEKYPDIRIKSIHVIDTTPRIRFQAQRFSTEFGGKVDKNYELFRDTLLADSLHVIETVFGVSENTPAVIVDAMMNFVNRSAKYYDGAVLSLKASREIFQRLDSKAPIFRKLSAFDLRYNDGMEVPALPEEESKTARVLEKIKESGSKLEIHYEEAKTKVSEGWEKPKEKEEEAKIRAFVEPMEAREMNAMSPTQFQDLAVQLLTKQGFDVRKVRKIPGGTLQIMVDFSHPVIGGGFMVLARQYPEGAQVHADLVRELDELCREEACKRGIYLVTGRFTEEAKNISRKMALDLVDGYKMAELMKAQPYEGRWTFRIVDEKGVSSNLSRMSLVDFQRETDLFLKSMGFQVAKIRRAPGGNVIAVADHPHPITGGKFAIMSKQFPPETRVPAELVSEFAHIMGAEFCHRGILMVPADFALDARALSRFSGIELVDRNLWDNLRRQSGLGA